MPTNAVTEKTLLRALPPIVNRQLQAKLDVADGWEKLAVHIPQDNNALFTTTLEDFDFEPRYTAAHLESFRRAGDKRGGSSTKSLITHWGSYNPSIKHLHFVLHQAELIDAANLIERYIIPATNLRQPNGNTQNEHLCPHMPNESPDCEINPLLRLPVQVSQDNVIPAQDARSAEGLSYHSGSSEGKKDEGAADNTALPDNDPSYPDMPDFSLLQKIDLDILKRITNNFNSKHYHEDKEGRLIGRGGFGNVYLGSFQSEHKVAIKVLKETNEDSLELFKTEVETLSSFKHKNVVLLLGYSVQGDTRCLVYQYLAEGSLEERLACRFNTPPLAVAMRMHILKGTAQGVAFLNSSGVVHRDLKTANILLDSAFVPKIGDFATAKVLNTDTLKDTFNMMSSKVIGTAAYLPPEALSFHVSDKWDAFSFGVVMLEVLTGLPVLDTNRQHSDLKHHIQEHCYVPGEDEEEEEGDEEGGTIFDLLDASGGKWGQDLATELYGLSQRCLEQNYRRRPKVKDILPQLEKLVYKDVNEVDV